MELGMSDAQFAILIELLKPISELAKAMLDDRLRHNMANPIVDESAFIK